MQEGKMVFSQDEIEDAVLSHFGIIFQGQRVPVYPSKAVDQVELTILELEQILDQTTPPVNPDLFESKICTPYTITDLDVTLQNLPNGKASGYDRIPNEMLKHSSFRFKLYLQMQTFLNRIIEDGEVPPDLNIGKCVLIYKVHQNIKNNIPLPRISGWRFPPTKPIPSHHHPIQHPATANSPDVQIHD